MPFVCAQSGLLRSVVLHMLFVKLTEIKNITADIFLQVGLVFLPGTRTNAYNPKKQSVLSSLFEKSWNIQKKG